VEKQATPALAIGEGWCEQPFVARSLVNVSGMSFGAISKPAVQALSRGAALAGLLARHRRGRPLALPHRGRLPT
jgi:glutamate synthase domain-containing protein 2